MPGDASIEAWATVAAALFAAMAAGLAWHLNRTQTDVSRRLVVIETARERREQQIHESRYLPTLSFKWVSGPELIDDESGQYMMSFHVHNDGPALRRRS